MTSSSTTDVYSWENRAEYCRLVEQYRLSEFDRQIEAMRQGIHFIVPHSIMHLITWAGIEKWLVVDVIVDEILNELQHMWIGGYIYRGLEGEDQPVVDCR